jgi:hypothetical protein
MPGNGRMGQVQPAARRLFFQLASYGLPPDRDGLTGNVPGTAPFSTAPAIYACSHDVHPSHPMDAPTDNPIHLYHYIKPCAMSSN